MNPNQASHEKLLPQQEPHEENQQVAQMQTVGQTLVYLENPWIEGNENLKCFLLEKTKN